jgi:hypothetical protein
MTSSMNMKYTILLDLHICFQQECTRILSPRVKCFCFAVNWFVIMIYGDYLETESHDKKGTSWSRSHGSWIYTHLCNQCLLSLTLWVRIPLRRGVLDTTLCDKVCQWLAAGLWFSPGSPFFSINKTDHHDKTEILLKVVLSTITPTPPLTHDMQCSVYSIEIHTTLYFF